MVYLNVWSSETVRTRSNIAVFTLNIFSFVDIYSDVLFSLSFCYQSLQALSQIFFHLLLHEVFCSTFYTFEGCFAENLKHIIACMHELFAHLRRSAYASAMENGKMKFEYIPSSPSRDNFSMCIRYRHFSRYLRLSNLLLLFHCWYLSFLLNF